jgi:hypothetical protein
MLLGIKPGDIIHLKKQHPCGGKEWQLIKTGAKMELKCLNCRHHVFFRRNDLERKAKDFVSVNNTSPRAEKKIQQSN